MANQLVDNKFSWVIKKGSWVIEKGSLLGGFENINSDTFVIGGCKWYLSAYFEKIIVDNYIHLYLQVADYESLSFGWRTYAKISITIINKQSRKRCLRKDIHHWFCEKHPHKGFGEIYLPNLYDKDSKTWINGELEITAEIDVLEVIGELDEIEESEETTQPQKRAQNNDGVLCNDLLNKTQQLKESFEVNGFIVLPSQVESLKLIFKSHPDFASGVLTKSPHLRTAYINVLLGLIATLCQSPLELSNEDLKEAYVTLSYAVNMGFKLDWLKKKLHQVLENKNKVESGEARLPEMEKEVQDLSKKYLDLKALMEKEKAEISSAKTPLSFDDFL